MLPGIFVYREKAAPLLTFYVVSITWFIYQARNKE